MGTIKKTVFGMVVMLALTVYGTTAMSQNTASGSVNVGYIAVKSGFDIESRIGHLPSSSQIGWMYKNFNQLVRQGAVLTGAQIRVVAYGNNNTDVIWSSASVSHGMHRALMPKSVMRATDVICAQVTGYRIVNVENVQISQDGTTSSWCETEFSQYVNAPWMQGKNGGYGFPLILEPM